MLGGLNGGGSVFLVGIGDVDLDDDDRQDSPDNDSDSDEVVDGGAERLGPFTVEDFESSCCCF